MHSFRPQKSTTSAAKVHSLDGEDWSSRCVANSEDLYYNVRSGGGGYTINEGATCLLAKGRQSTLAEHGDHLLRFSFIASIHVERPRASNDREKMEVPRYRAPRSVCLAEIAAGLDLSDVGPGWSVARKEKAANVGAVTVTSRTGLPPTSLQEGGERAFVFTRVLGCGAGTGAAGQEPHYGNATLLFWHSVLIMLYCVGACLKLISFNNVSHNSFTTASNTKTASTNWYFLL